MKVLLIDFDGVLTCGKTYRDHLGHEFKTTHTRDNRAIAEFVSSGYDVYIISASSWEGMKSYAANLNVRLFSLRNKLDILNILEPEDHLTIIGDDVWEIELMKRCNLKYCPSNADEEVKRVPGIKVLHAKGGEGCLAELARYLL